MKRHLNKRTVMMKPDSRACWYIPVPTYSPRGTRYGSHLIGSLREESDNVLKKVV